MAPATGTDRIVRPFRGIRLYLMAAVPATYDEAQMDSGIVVGDTCSAADNTGRRREGPENSRPFCFRRFGARPDKKVVDRSSGEPEFVEDALHGNSDGLVVGVDGFWVVRAAGWAEWLSGGEKGFDGFVSENEQRGHRPQTGW
jgi:hypothetical protein